MTGFRVARGRTAALQGMPDLTNLGKGSAEESGGVWGRGKSGICTKARLPGRTLRHPLGWRVVTFELTSDEAFMTVGQKDAQLAEAPCQPRNIYSLA